MDTLALNPATWDLTCNQFGDLATFGDATPQSAQTGPGMRLAQDVASRARAWLGEVYFDTAQGINYPLYLGGPPNLTVLQSAFSMEALNVPLCQTALANFQFIAGDERAVTGVITLSDVAGNGSQVTL